MNCINLSCEVIFSTILDQGVCHCDSMELPSNDVGLEERSLFGSWKHTCVKTCTGKTHTGRYLKALKSFVLPSGATEKFLLFLWNNLPFHMRSTPS